MKNMLAALLGVIVIASCSTSKQEKVSIDESKIKVIYDTDANNELDDQHALAYLLSNGSTFYLNGVTVNATRNGGDITEHYKEAERILTLYNSGSSIPLLKGCNGSFTEIDSAWNPNNFDGRNAVDFIISQSKMYPDLVLLAVGKLTNVAVALKKDPSLAERAKVVWLGSNYPGNGEYNLVNDTTALNYVLKSNIPFEMVVCRYGKPSGTDAVRVTPEEVKSKMAGLGPESSKDVQGRNGGNFNHFGDYAANLFENIDLHGDPPSRALFDMVAAAILKNKGWGESFEIPAPLYYNEQWNEQPDNTRKITIWENFNKEEVLNDFFSSIENYEVAKPSPLP